MAPLEADSYLKTGSNVLKVLEYQVGRVCLGINILKVNRIIHLPEQLVRVPSAHLSIAGLIEDHKRIVPIVQLSEYLGVEDKSDRSGHRILLTEFFGRVNGFEVSSVSDVHTITWDKVEESEEVLGGIKNPYVIAIARPSPDKNIWLLDYEKIILELSPKVEHQERLKFTGGVEGRGRRILIAEDSAAVRGMLEVELGGLGFKVLSARDGQEAWEIFEREKDMFLVLSDVEMPRMDGLALTKRIKEKDKSVRVIVYSSIGDIGMKERAKFLEADAHVTKLNVDELLGKITEMAGR